MTKIQDWLDITTIHTASEDVVVAQAPCGAIQIRNGLAAKDPFQKWGWEVLYRHEATPNPHPFPAATFLDDNHPDTKVYQAWEKEEVSRIRAEVAEIVKAQGKLPRFAPDLSLRLEQILKESHLSVYGAAQIVAAKTGEELKTVHDRLSRHLERPPKSWLDIENTLFALGYQIQIEQMDGNCQLTLQGASHLLEEKRGEELRGN